MGRRRSVYLSAETDRRLEACGIPLPKVIDRGLDAVEAEGRKLPAEARPADIMVAERKEPVVTVPTVEQCPHRNWGRFCIRCDALVSESGYPIRG